MVQLRRSGQRFIEIMIILAGCLLVVGISFVAEDSSAVFSYVLIGIGGFLLVCLLMIAMAFRREPRTTTIKRVVTEPDKHREQANEIYKQRVEEAIQKALGKQERYPITEYMSVNEYSGKLAKDICMVCKLFLSEKDKILQCPICESLYHKDHLLEWITAKKKCPVCTQVLYTK
ncbi:MAG: hypothetical protein ACTSXA_02540 [Candidatus Heimdallarchaeota archaeon]